MKMFARLQERLRAPRWLAISAQQPQNLVRVIAATQSRRIDVTQQNVVAALDPLTIALRRTEELGAVGDGDAVELELVDRATDFTLGRLQLEHAEVLRMANTEAALFHVRSGTDHCVSWPERALGRMARRMRAREPSGQSGGFHMSPVAVERLFIFYICPRPVVLVSACEDGEGNLFPMDLLGPFGEGRFALALRNTSPSVATMKRARKVVLADIPPSECGTAYRLGAHHKTAAIDWAALPFPVHRTPSSNIPYPAIALRIRELALLDHVVRGSHCFFIAEIIDDRSLSSGPRLFHTTSTHQLYRSRCGTPLEAAIPSRG